MIPWQLDNFSSQREINADVRTLYLIKNDGEKKIDVMTFPV